MNGFARALLDVGRVATFGAIKYEPDGWLQVENGFNRYTAALYRHLLLGSFEHHDSDSGLSHNTHAAWNALARLELELRRKDHE